METTITLEMMKDYIGIGIFFGVVLFVLLFVIMNKDNTKILKSIPVLVLVIILIFCSVGKVQIPFISSFADAWKEAWNG